ncbi:tetratricopeptide repeat protein [Rubinisphaera margarita]|uniref:tetratricopeptide repeat protein n=1 Tax=Rubinisphaera margarita TaxID=2909586 RepID=UPI001EE96D77|nr:hypothetical protein [Rubinisphaera margarita]MCG6157888.1 hypothetical protein [Rubinisphaera margarita]
MARHLRTTFRWSFPVVMMLAVLGCQNQDENPKSQTEEKTGSSQARENLERRRICKANLDKVYQILRPSAENMDSEPTSALVILNQWFGSCAEMPDGQLDVSAPAFASLNDEEALGSLNNPSASIADIHYLRDQLLMRQMVTEVVKFSPTDVEKVRAVMEYVRRNLPIDELLIDGRLATAGLLPQETLDQLNPFSIPRALQDVALAGRGLPYDRIWMAASMLRQLNIESLLLTHDADLTLRPEVPALLLIPLESQLVVFCPQLGIEIRPEGDAEAWELATFNADLKNLFAGLDQVTWPEDSPITRMKNADWTTAKVMLPVAPISASPRMEALQLDFVGDMACNLHQSAAIHGDDGLKKSLGSIIGDREIEYWPYPHRMYTGLLDPTDEEARLRQLTVATLLKEVQSIRASQDQNEQTSYRVSMERKMLKARVEQLIARDVEALQTYMRIRLQFRVPGQGAQVELENLMRFLQAEDAHYWSAVAQFETEQYRSAGDTLQNYLERYQQGHWVQSARMLWAEAEAAEGNPQRAIEILQQGELQEDQKVRRELLIQKWKPAN